MRTIAQDPVQRTQRVKVGMIGLAAVLLLIGLAAAIFSTASRDRQAPAAGARSDVFAAMGANNTADGAATAKEPLAELGVAPSAATDENAATAENAAATTRPAAP